MKFPILSTWIATVILVDSSNARRPKARSVAFAGGGFRAHAVASGVMSGLLGAAQDSNVLKEKPTFDTLMRSIDTIASNSGGTWFATQFIYSANFEKLLTKMAEIPFQEYPKVTGLYYNEFVKHLFGGDIKEEMLQMPEPEFTTGDFDVSLLFNSSGGFNLTVLQDNLEFGGPVGNYVLGKILTAFLSIFHYDEPWVALISNYFRLNNVSWRSFVDMLLRIPGDFDPELALDSAPVNPWAQSKRYAVAGGLVQPNPLSSPQRMTAGAFEQVCISAIGVPDEYSISMTNQYPSAGLSTPITFSTYLENGNDQETESPFPFIRTPEYKMYKEQTYHGSYYAPWELWGIDADISSAFVEHDVALGPGFRSHRMKILDVATTSSAFLSQITSLYEQLGVIADILNSVGLYDFLTEFITPIALNPSIPAEKMFDIGLDLKETHGIQTCQGWHREHQKAMISPLTDGGYIDNTAVSNVLADAQDGDEFTLIVNSEDDVNVDLKNLFSGKALDSDFTHVPISSKKSQDEIEAEIRNFRTLEIGVNSRSVLKSIQYGTIDVETASQVYFGVKAGIHIKLNIIAVQADMGLAPFSWNKPAELVGEIVAAFKSPANSEPAQHILKNFFGYCECDCANNEYNEAPVKASIVTVQRNPDIMQKNAFKSRIDYIELIANNNYACTAKWIENFDDGKEHFITPYQLDDCFRGKVVSMRIRYKDICLKTGGSIPVNFVFDSSLPNEVQVLLDGDDVHDNLSPTINVFDRCDMQPSPDKVPVFDAASVEFSRFHLEDIRDMRDTEISHIEFVSSNNCKFLWTLDDMPGVTNSIPTARILASSCMEPYDILTARFVYSRICPLKSYQIPGKIRIGTDSTKAIVFAMTGNKPEQGLDATLTIKK